MKKSPDYILIGVVTALMVLGLLILSSASASVSQEKTGNTFYYLRHQILFGILPGIFLAYIFFKIKLSHLKKIALPLLLVNLFFLGILFIPQIGSGFQQGATRWITIGPISFQPSEFLKISFILYLASWLKTRANFSKGKSFLKRKFFNETFIAFFAILGLVSLLLILQPDISTLGVISIVALIMYFLAGAPGWHIILMFSMGIASLFALIKVAPYRMNRFLIFLDPDLYPKGIGYHLSQALIAVGSGGLKGLGLGLSRQRFGFLPGTMSDSIFAVFAEETGFIGGLVLISLFLLFLVRGFKISKRVGDKTLQLIGIGITSWIAIQAFINVGAMIRVVPLTGIPLPFISYGGSAIIAELIGVGILLNMSKQLKT